MTLASAAYWLEQQTPPPPEQEHPLDLRNTVESLLRAIDALGFPTPRAGALATLRWAAADAKLLLYGPPPLPEPREPTGCSSGGWM